MSATKSLQMVRMDRSMTKKRGLGKGLGALIPSAGSSRLPDSEEQSGVLEVAVDQIVPNPHQP